LSELEYIQGQRPGIRPMSALTLWNRGCVRALLALLGAVTTSVWSPAFALSNNQYLPLLVAEPFVLTEIEMPASLVAMKTRQINIISGLERAGKRPDSMLLSSGVTSNPAGLIAQTTNRILMDHSSHDGVRIGRFLMLTQIDDTSGDRMVRSAIAADSYQEDGSYRNLFLLVPSVLALALLGIASLYWNRRIAQENQKRKQAEQLLVNMTDRLRTGVFQIRQYKDKPSIVEFTNALTRKLARYKPETDSGKQASILDYIDQDDRAWVEKKLRACMSSRQHFRETFRFNFPNNEKGWILADANCRVDDDGANVWSGYLFDLTSERLLSEELNELLVSRDEFMSTSGHELRTPLQSLALALEGVTLAKEPVQINKLIGTARSAVSDLIELVDDFIELSSMNSRPLELHNESYDFHDLMKSLSLTFANVADKQFIRFDYSISTDVPRWVWGDPMRVKQVLYNLLGNAFKYTDEGTVSFHIHVDNALHRLGEDAADDTYTDDDTESISYKADAARALIDIDIIDTGIGIEAKYVPTIFQPFSTIGPSNRKSTGLGLAIVDRLVTVLGGTIRVDTQAGVGSKFSLRLPVNIEKREQTLVRQTVHKAEDVDWNLHSKNLLVVDDNLLVRETLAALLQLDGWSVLQADSACTALSVLETYDCVALVTDQQMPGMTGIELARVVHSHTEKLGSRPVMIMMSGGMSREDTNMANDVFDVVLFKPIKTAQIRHAIESVTSESVK